MLDNERKNIVESEIKYMEKGCRIESRGTSGRGLTIRDKSPDINRNRPI